jgi:hypothetical protein
MVGSGDIGRMCAMAGRRILGTVALILPCFRGKVAFGIADTAALGIGETAVSIRLSSTKEINVNVPTY